MGQLVSILAKEYKTTVPSILHKLDQVSGDLEALNLLLSGDQTVKWSDEEDDLLHKNADLLKKWKGEERVDLRKKYLSFKNN
jgi:hypothetical protein